MCCAPSRGDYLEPLKQNDRRHDDEHQNDQLAYKLASHGDLHEGLITHRRAAEPASQKFA